MESKMESKQARQEKAVSSLIPFWRWHKERKMKIIDVALIGHYKRIDLEAVIWLSNGDRLNIKHGNGIPEQVYYKLGKLAKSPYRSIHELAKVQTANRIIDLFHMA